MSDTLYTLITGASSGIGRGIAKILSPNHNLILHGRNVEELEKTRRACTNSINHLVWVCDLSRIEDVEKELVSFISNNHLGVSNYIHSAGTVNIMPIRLVSLKNAQELMNVNFFSAFEISKILTKRINSPHLENIIFISSIFSSFGSKGQSIYAASKGAMDAMMKSLAVELAPKVKVNSILPGAIHTEMANSAFENEKYISKIKEDYLIGFGQAEDVGNLVEFLLSPRARWITGQQLFLDGGKSCH